jgi:hypothetical protein
LPDVLPSDIEIGGAKPVTLETFDTTSYNASRETSCPTNQPEPNP